MITPGFEFKTAKGKEQGAWSKKAKSYGVRAKSKVHWKTES
jgi:hypothetical protein